MKQKPTVSHERIRREHAELVELETHLLKAFAERNQPPSRIAELFRGIYDRAIAHFEDEAEGVVHDAAAADPALAKECDQLCQEHQQLRSELDALLEKTRSAAGTAEWWDSLETAFRDFSVKLYQHESSEQRLIDHIESSNH